jgi:hypothetical protein
VSYDLFSYTAAGSISRDGRQAVFRGVLPGPDKSPHLLLLDIASGKTRRIETSVDVAQAGFPIFNSDGESVVFPLGGAFSRIISIPLSGGPPHDLFTLAQTVANSLSIARDGSIYAALHNSRQVVTRNGFTDGRGQRIRTLNGVAFAIATLPNGALSVTEDAGGKARLMAFEPGKDPTPLISTNEETLGPPAILGPSTIAFRMGSPLYQTIGIADFSTGRIVRKITPAKGSIGSLCASPDGKTLYVTLEGGGVWSLPSNEEKPTLKRLGDGDLAVLDPSGRSLVAEVISSSGSSLYRIPVEGGPAEEIRLTGGYRVNSDGLPLPQGSINAEGQLVMSLNDPNRWFFQTGVVDLRTGKVTVLPTEPNIDSHNATWDGHGGIISLGSEVQSSIWRFRPSTK